MIAFGWVTNLLQRGLASWKRMLEILDTRSRRSSIRRRRRRRSRWPAIRGAIEFRHLTFAYGERPVLARHLARHRAGHDAWPSSGRPAAASPRSLSLLPRLHDPPPGTVFVDGVDVRECAAGGSARRHRHGAAGAVPLLGDRRAEHRVRRAGTRRCGGHSGGRVDRAARQGRRRLSSRVGDDGGRARPDAVRRPEAAHGDRARAAARSADSHPGRCAVGGGHVHRGRDPASGCGA